MCKYISKNYIYQVGDTDSERLGILNDVYNPGSQQTLAGIIKDKDAKLVLDIGCGQGIMTCWIAQQLKSCGGIVCGIDISNEQLDIAKRRAGEQKLDNIMFIQSSVFDIKNISAALASRKPDVIYCRWLLMHLAKEEIPKVMSGLYSLLAPGGVIVNEEVTLRESGSSPASEAYSSWLKLFDDLAKKMDVDYDIGSTLAEIWEKQGITPYQTLIHKPKFSVQQCRFFNLDLQGSLPMITRAGVATSEEVMKLEVRLESAFKSSEPWMTNRIVMCQKP
jgi:ubiquinone/menaquinone biosynthesis C-methylase UbiE